MGYHAVYRCRLCNTLIHSNEHAGKAAMKELLVDSAEDRLRLSRIAGAIAFERFMVHDCDEGRTVSRPNQHGLCDLVGMEADFLAGEDR